jgi:rhamnose transport system ATP-binding protein
VGITAIHQETVLFDELSVTENIFVGQYLYTGLLKNSTGPPCTAKPAKSSPALKCRLTHAPR